MPILKRGDQGPDVEAIQNHLSRHGFDAPGVFGPATEAGVTAFQERHGLLPDGIVGPLTREALHAPASPGTEEPPSTLRIDTALRLPETSYFAESQAKDLVVLHHTAGGSARSTFNWWKSAPGRIATAYIVGRDGTIHELFDPRHWAWHLGLQGTNGRVDKRSVGIELANEGALVERNGTLYKFGRTEPGFVYDGEVYDHGTPWRGHRYFAAYADAQVEAAVALTAHLLDVFKIERATPADPLAQSPANYDFRGVIGHQHVRQDKTDVHPGFAWDLLIDACDLERTVPGQ